MRGWREIASGFRFGVAASLALLAVTAQAQPPERRSGQDREVVVQLAYVLGEAHALRRLCAGPQDATWYIQMQKLEAEEAGDDAARRQLVEAFNAGFAARQTQFGGCSARSQAAERAAAQKGRALAGRLARGG